jgi:hypothetical protein
MCKQLVILGFTCTVCDAIHHNVGSSRKVTFHTFLIITSLLPVSQNDVFFIKVMYKMNIMVHFTVNTKHEAT